MTGGEGHVHGWNDAMRHACNVRPPMRTLPFLCLVHMRRATQRCSTCCTGAHFCSGLCTPRPRPPPLPPHPSPQSPPPLSLLPSLTGQATATSQLRPRRQRVHQPASPFPSSPPHPLRHVRVARAMRLLFSHLPLFVPSPPLHRLHHLTCRLLHPLLSSLPSPYLPPPRCPTCHACTERGAPPHVARGPASAQVSRPLALAPLPSLPTLPTLCPPSPSPPLRPL